MTDRTNADRIDLARRMMRVYDTPQCRGNVENAPDAIADLLHLMAENYHREYPDASSDEVEDNVEDMMLRAFQHFTAERQEEATN